MNSKDTCIKVNGKVIDAQSMSDESGCPVDELGIQDFMEAIAEELEPTKRLQIIIHELDD